MFKTILVGNGNKLLDVFGWRV